MSFHFPLKDTIDALQKNGGAPFIELMKKGNMSVELYAPKEQDLQTPHDRDEIYVIASGKGLFRMEKDTIAFRTGDLLFVPAFKEHRFESFTPGFSTWVIFL